ncbi:MAG: diguanylate cyclase [Aquabacterium sp.]|nr:diguanylate cyclase [Aquabacterium sp.]
MNHPAAFVSVQPDISAIQYAVLLTLLLPLLLAGTMALMQARLPRLYERLHLDWFSDQVLSTDANRRTMCQRFTVAAANCVAGLAALNYGAIRGIVDSDSTRILTIAAVISTAVFYGLLRSGLSQRLKDPTMTAAQMSTAMSFLAWGYLLGGPGRSIALMLAFVILIFGIFNATSVILIKSCVFAAVIFGAAILKVANEPGTTAAQVDLQLVNFIVLLIVLVSVCMLVTQLNTLRDKSKTRKSELTHALARIGELATRDELTGLFNRRHMLEQLNTESQRSNRSNRVFCIGVIDVDHFKSVNDLHGHGVGDQVLTGITTAITAGLRETDVIARWGGEEFLVMFTDTDSETAAAVLSRIQQALRHTVVSASTPNLRVSFSAGVTLYEKGERLSEAIDRADRALYLAKTNGRNRTVRLPPDQPMGLAA